MELKVVCQCGQKYKFDVEPAGGKMPFTVNCPACNLDGTAAASEMLATQYAAAPVASAPPPPPVPASGGSLRINRAAETAAPPPLTAMAAGAPPPISALRPAVEKKIASGEFSLPLGILGAVLGAGAGCGLMFGFWNWTHFRFPLMGIAVGAACGYGARWLARGTANSLSVIAAATACLSVTGTFVLMYGGFAMFNIISIVICTGVAYRAASA